MLHLVKSRLLTALLLLCSLSTGSGQGAPDARQILRGVRMNQTAQQQTLSGVLRNGPKKVPFRMAVNGPTVRYDFSNPPQSLILHLGENSSTLEEWGRGKVTPARYDTLVQDTDISYEDLSLRFLYWPNAKVVGEDTKLTRRCWMIDAIPSRGESQYSRVRLWIEKQTGTLLQAEAYDAGGNFARRFTVRSGQRDKEGNWYLKQMRIESAPKPGAKDRTPTYLEVQQVAK